VGTTALTSRAVTTEAGFAKGVLHRHFADFDAFLAELVLVHVEQVHWRATELDACAETGGGSTAMVSAYLTAEQQYGRVTADTDISTLAPTLIGAVHLRVADREEQPAQTQDLRPFVQTVLGGVLIGG
jgi:AcrR family transcriptional regulator